MMFKRLLCNHLLVEDLIFCGNPNTHRVVEHCVKCNYNKIVFSGNRDEYYRNYLSQGNTV